MARCGCLSNELSLGTTCPGRDAGGLDYREMLLAPHGAEAVAAVHRPVASWQEGDLGVNAALGAYRWMHLSRAAAKAATATATTTTTTLLSACAAARGAAAGLIGEPLGIKKFLFARREDKNGAAVPTCQVLV